MSAIQIVSKRDGYVIIIVILFCIIISIVVATVTNSIQASLSSVKIYNNIIKARELAKSGIEITAGKIINGNKKIIDGSDLYYIGTDQIFVIYRDESARIDINTSPPELISGIFIKLGANEKAAAGYADRIVAWRDAGNDPKQQEAKMATYRERGRPLPRNGPFSSTFELFYVLDIPSEILEKTIPWLTTENATDKINIMIADPIVLMAIPNLSDGVVREIMDARKNKGASMDKIIQSLGQNGSFLGQDKGRGVKIDVTVKLNKSIIKSYEAIIIINNDKKQEKPYNVVTWYEN